LSDSPSSGTIPVICRCGATVAQLPRPHYDSIAHFPLTCSHCGNEFEINTDRGRPLSRDDFGILRFDVLITAEIQSNVPESSACLQEGTIALNGRGYRAAAVMARAALEVCLEWAGFTTQKLVDKIDAAVSANALVDYDRERATNSRLIGNFGAHGTCASYAPGDGLMKVSDAKFSLELSSELVQTLIRWKMSQTGGGP
jgi:Domain of unknown function (DUF4145)